MGAGVYIWYKYTISDCFIFILIWMGFCHTYCLVPKVYCQLFVYSCAQKCIYSITILYLIIFMFILILMGFFSECDS